MLFASSIFSNAPVALTFLVLVLRAAVVCGSSKERASCTKDADSLPAQIRSYTERALNAYADCLATSVGNSSLTASPNAGGGRYEDVSLSRLLALCLRASAETAAAPGASLSLAAPKAKTHHHFSFASSEPHRTCCRPGAGGTAAYCPRRGARFGCGHPAPHSRKGPNATVVHSHAAAGLVAAPP